MFLYFMFGFGAAYSGGFSSLMKTAHFFVGLMILTAATGVLFPICAIISTITKNTKLGKKIFLLLITIITLYYFFVIPMTTNFYGIDSLETQVTSINEIAETAEEEYKEEYVELLNVEIKDYGSLDYPGYREVKRGIKGTIKNTGDKTLSYVKIIVYFLNSENTHIGEKSFTIISTKSFYKPDSPFKPNYAKEFGYVIEDDAPPGWSGEVKVEISEVNFEE